MSLNLYYQDEDSNLIFLADLEESDGEEANPALFLDMFLDEADEDQQFDAYLVIDDENGIVTILQVEDHEPVNTRRSISVLSADDEVEDVIEEVVSPAPKRRGRPPGSKSKKVKSEEVPAVTPKRRGRPPGSKNKPGSKKPGPKASSKKPEQSVKKPSSKKALVKKNEASEE